MDIIAKKRPRVSSCMLSYIKRSPSLRKLDQEVARALAPSFYDQDFGPSFITGWLARIHEIEDYKHRFTDIPETHIRAMWMHKKGKKLELSLARFTIFCDPIPTSSWIEKKSGDRVNARNMRQIYGKKAAKFLLDTEIDVISLVIDSIKDSLEYKEAWKLYCKLRGHPGPRYTDDYDRVSYRALRKKLGVSWQNDFWERPDKQTLDCTPVPNEYYLPVHGWKAKDSCRESGRHRIRSKVSFDPKEKELTRKQCFSAKKFKKGL